MTRNEIITEYYNDKGVNDALINLCPQHLRADLKQHIFLILSEKTEGEVTAMHFKGQLRFFIVRIIINSIRGNGRSDFAKLFRSHEELIDEPIVYEENYDHDKDRLLNQCEAAAQELYWYNQTLLQEYLRVGSYRKVADLIGIPTMAVYDAITKAKQEIKEKVCK